MQQLIQKHCLKFKMNKKGVSLRCDSGLNLILHPKHCLAYCLLRREVRGREEEVRRGEQGSVPTGSPNILVFFLCFLFSDFHSTLVTLMNIS